MKLTIDQRQAVLASIIGDGYLSYAYSKAKLPRLKWNMGNKDHALYKNEFFGFLSPTYSERENGGWGSMTYSVLTSSHPCLKDIHDEFYVENKKDPNKLSLIFNELNDVGWAWFYGDDGHLGGNDTVYLHTEGYGEKGSKCCSDAVNNYLNINDGSKVFMYYGGTPKKERYAVKLTAEASDEFIKRIKKHMANGMEYKISENNINRRYREK